MSNYEQETRTAYRSEERARAYVDYQERQWSWGRVVTAVEQRAVGRLLLHVLADGDTVFDVPCGTGILGKTLARFAVRVIGGDISREMMARATTAYAPGAALGFVQADITKIPLPNDSVAGVIALGFMHRVPSGVRQAALTEIHRICHRFALVSFSLDSNAQRAKHAALHALRRRHVPAPYPASLAEVEREIQSVGFSIASRTAVLPLLSAESLFLLEK